MIQPFISIVIPAFNEERYIKDCLASIFSQDYPIDSMEVIVVDGASTDSTKSVIQELFPSVVILNNPDRIVPISMNMGITAAKGEYIIRIDAHAKYPTNYVSYLISEAMRLKADNVGAVCRTLPLNSSPKAKAIATALSTKFGMGDSAFRVGANEVMEVDTVPFGCYHHSIFKKVGMYDEELVRNQDDELNARIIKSGGRIFLLPSLVIDYYGRDTYQKTWKMFYQYGLFKPLVNKKLKGAATLRQFVPLCFVLYLILLPIFIILFSSYKLLILIPMILYIMADLYFSVRHGGSLSTIGHLLLVYPTIHIAYGLGYIDGILRIVLRRPFVAKVNR